MDPGVPGSKRPWEADAVMARIQHLAGRARQAGTPVLWLQHDAEGTPLAHGSEGWALPAALAPADNEPRLRKTTPDAFLRSGLAEWLAAHGVQHLVLCGYASEFCISTSARRAAALGFAVTLAADAHTTHDKPHAGAALIRAHENATLAALTSFGPRITPRASADIHFQPKHPASTSTGQSTDPAPPDTDTDTTINTAPWLQSEAQLAPLYDQPSEAALRKESPVLTAPYRALLEASPFVVLATSGPGGLDASPRGDQHQALRVQDERTLLLPDRRGNHRLVSLRNILADPRVALLCLIPGSAETLRISGHAQLSTDATLCQQLAVDGKPPATVVVIHIHTVYFQCARALLRSQLWQPETWLVRAALPSAGQMLSAATGGSFNGEAYDRELPLRQRDSLY